MGVWGEQEGRKRKRWGGLALERKTGWVEAWVGVVSGLERCCRESGS